MIRELQRIDPEEAKSVQKVTSEFFDLGKLEGQREGQLENQRRIVVNMHAKVTA